MPHFEFIDPRNTLIHRYIPRWETIFPRPANVRILIVMEQNISPGPPGSGFALGRVVTYLRNETFGFVNFTVDFALRGTEDDPSAVNVNPSPGEWEFKYTDFRFNSVDGGNPVIQEYDEVWCFSIEPLTHNDGSNSSLETHPLRPDDAEVAVLSDWMDAGGGLLAMGDHNFLGSAMCYRIPRAGTMRAWLKDSNDGRSVPNRTGTDRHDTNRPQNASQDPNHTPTPATIPNSAEQDAVTQPLDWKAYSVWSNVFQRRYRPHPVLCGGSLGIIDRFPDHPHEGLVIHESLINLGAKCQHDDGKYEYPAVDGMQPGPEVIAWVDTLPTPPYNHAKGNQPARHFPAIGVYDGHEIEYGRVLVDSTWHHWFDYNLFGLEAADTADFRKIRRYYQNVAIWLAPRDKQRQMLRYASFWTVLQPVAIEELSPDTPFYRLGGNAIDILGRSTSDCLVIDWLIDLLPIELVRAVRELPEPDPCWTCPPIDLLTNFIMGGIVHELLPLREQLVAQSWGREIKSPDFDPEQIDRALESGMKSGLEALVGSISENAKALSALDERVSKALR